MKRGNNGVINYECGYQSVRKIFSMLCMAVLLVVLAAGCSKNSDSDEDNTRKGSKASKREQTDAYEGQESSTHGFGTLFGSEDREETEQSGDQDGTKGVMDALRSMLTGPDNPEELSEDYEAAEDIDRSEGYQEDNEGVEDSDSSDGYQEDTAPTSPPELIDSPIVGRWRNGDKSRPTYIGAMDTNAEYVFYTDGSYSQITIMSINYIYQCTGYIGYYTVTGDEILITNRFKTTFGIEQYDWQEAYIMAAASEYEPVEDVALPLEITDNENILINTVALFRVE